MNQAERRNQGEPIKKNPTTGTPAYMALEVFSGKATTASDMWAMGVSIFEMLCNKRPFKGDNAMALYAGLRRNDIDFSAIPESGASEMALQFVVALLKKEQAERPSVHDALA